MDSLPSREVLAAFGAADPRALGGRERAHWRVRCRGEDLVLTRYAEPEASVLYEHRLLRAVRARGWSVPAPVEGPVLVEGERWSLAPFLPGEPNTGADDEPRRRGRLLAEFHEALRTLPPTGPRPGFRRAEAILADPEVERTIAAAETRLPEEAAVVRWHLDRARARLDGLDLGKSQGQVVHGDFATWNLLFEGDRLTGIIDFELAREDHRVAEFALAWRGRYDAVVEAYDEVSPLSPEEWAMLTPVWWLGLVEGWCRSVRGGAPGDPWSVGKLRARSPLMGPDRDPPP